MLPSVSRFEVSTGDPHPLAPLCGFPLKTKCVTKKVTHFADLTNCLMNTPLKRQAFFFFVRLSVVAGKGQINDRLYNQRSTMAPLRGSALVQQAANQLRCHSEPVRFPGVGISIVIENAFL